MGEEGEDGDDVGEIGRVWAEWVMDGEEGGAREVEEMMRTMSVSIWGQWLNCASTSSAWAALFGPPRWLPLFSTPEHSASSPSEASTYDPPSTSPCAGFGPSLRLFSSRLHGAVSRWHAPSYSPPIQPQSLGAGPPAPPAGPPVSHTPHQARPSHLLVSPSVSSSH